MADLLAHFARNVTRHPDRVAIIDGRGRATGYLALDQRIRAFAARWHSRGIGPGDRVLVAMGISADLYASLAALWRLGATVVLPEPAMGLAGLRHAARISDPAAFCASGWYRALKWIVPDLRKVPLICPRGKQGAAPEPPIDSDVTALISFTSGSTGAPKAIPRSHGFLEAQYRAVAPILHSDGPERDLVAFPVFTLINLAEGRTSVLPCWKASRAHHLSPARLSDWLDRQQVTRALIPPALGAVLGQADPPARLRHVFTGGGPVFPDLVQNLQRHARVTCVYGSTEAEPIAHLEAHEITTEDRARMAEGAGLLVGKPVPEAQVDIRDGEVIVTGNHVNKTYLDPAQNAENKISRGDVIWHRTGDLGWFDAKGRLWLLGRKGAEVAGGTGPIHPFAVEVAARGWPGISDTALMERAGQAVLVVVGDAAHLDDWTRRAAGFGITDIVPLDAIPKDRRHRSKVDRAALAAEIANHARSAT